MVSRVFLLICALQIWAVHAQFQFFDQMFGGHRQQQQQQQPSGGQWAAYSESIPCSDYLCPDTLSCVQKPVDCPCPNVQDVKCVVPDEDEDDAGTVVCVRGETDCVQVSKLTRKFAPSGKKSK